MNERKECDEKQERKGKKKGKKKENKKRKENQRLKWDAIECRLSLDLKPNSFESDSR